MKKPALPALLILLLVLVMAGCFKEYTENFAEEELLIENAAIAEQQADEALEIIYQCEVILKLYPGQIINLDSCASFYEDPINKKIVIDFGDTTFCSTFYGKYRRGKIIASYTTAVGDTLDSRVLTFENYKTARTTSAKYLHVEGSVSLTNLIQTAANVISADRTLSDFKVSLPNGSDVTFNGTHQRRWTGGMGDTLEFNNVYSLSGTMTGVSSTGRNFETAVSGTIPVVINFDCATRGRFARTAGLVDMLKLDGYPDRTRIVNYGDGTCLNDNIEIQTTRRTFGTTAY